MISFVSAFVNSYGVIVMGWVGVEGGCGASRDFCICGSILSFYYSVTSSFGWVFRSLRSVLLIDVRHGVVQSERDLDSQDPEISKYRC